MRISSTSNKIRSAACSKYPWWWLMAVHVAFIFFALPATANAGMLYQTLGGYYNSPATGFQYLWGGVPKVETFQINVQNQYVSNYVYHPAPFTYSAKMGVYEQVSTTSVAHIIPPGMFELSTDVPAQNLSIGVSVYGEGRLIGGNLMTTAAMQFWGKLAPGDVLEYSFSAGTQGNYPTPVDGGRSAAVGGSVSSESGFNGTFSGYYGPNTPQLFGSIDSNGEFFVDFRYTSDLYGTGPYGVDLKHFAGFSLHITKLGSSPGKSTVYFDPGAGTYEAGSNPDFPFIPPAVPEPSTLVLFGGLAASFVAFRRRTRRTCLASTNG